MRMCKTIGDNQQRLKKEEKLKSIDVEQIVYNDRILKLLNYVWFDHSYNTYLATSETLIFNSTIYKVKKSSNEN